jgi:hypothetical protein
VKNHENKKLSFALKKELKWRRWESLRQAQDKLLFPSLLLIKIKKAISK